MHPANAILCWIWVACWLQLLQPTPLVVVTALLVTVTLWQERARMLRMLRRVRVLLAAIILVYGWSTPGLYVWPGWLSPTREGLWFGLIQGFRLLAVLTSLQWLLRALKRDDLFAGVYLLAAPLGWLGVNRQRWALRLALTMDYAETLLAERQDWRSLWQQLANPAADEPENAVVVDLRIRALSPVQTSLMFLLLVSIVLTLLFLR